VIKLYTSFCPFPNNKKKVLIGDSEGKLFVGELNDFSKKNFIEKNYWSCLIKIDLVDKSEFNLQSSPIRNLIKLSETEIVGHSYNGDVFLYDCRADIFPFHLIKKGIYGKDNIMYQIASVGANQFIISGNYGVFWFFNRNNECLWDIHKKEYNSPHAHFALEVYNQDLNQYIVNNFKGDTKILDNSGSIIANLNGFDRNLQNLVLQEALIAAVDYFGNTHLYSKIETKNDEYLNIQTIDCDFLTKIYPHIVFHKGNFFAAFPNALWKFDPALSKIEKNEINCVDLESINEEILVLTKDSIVLVNFDKFYTPDDFIKYKFITVGIIGFTDTGKSTFCYRLIYNEYKEDLGTTSGTLTWNLEYDDGAKIFIKDIPGQHDEIEFYFPKMIKCDLIIGMCKIKDSIEPWKRTISMCKTIRDQMGIKHFIFLRSKCDDNEKARKNAIQDELRTQGFKQDLLFDVSAKTGNGVEEIKKILKSSVFWENNKIFTESKIKTYLISAIGQAQASREKKIALKHLEIPNFKQINPKILEAFIKKLSEEEFIYYIASKREILLNTEDMGKVESYILNLFSEGKGFYWESSIKIELKERFNDLDLEELKYYYDQFIDYLINSNKLIVLIPGVYIIKEKLIDRLTIPNEILCNEIKIELPIQILEIVELLNKLSLKLNCISKNQLKFTDSKKDGEIYVEFPELNTFNVLADCRHIKIYLKISKVIAKTFEILYEKIRDHKLIDLPKILNFTNISKDSLENCLNLFNYPDETPFLDYKTEMVYKKGKKRIHSKIQSEILKDIIALGNTSYINDNSAYYIIGLEEKDGKFLRVKNIENQSILFQQIAFLCREYIKTGFNLSHLRIKVYDLFQKMETGKIRIKMPFTGLQKSSECLDEIMIIHITRDPKVCLELREDLLWSSPKGVKIIAKGKSWIRMGSHTFDILNEERKGLLTN